LFPSKAIGSVVGIGGAISGIGSMLAAELTGRILQNHPGNYLPMFIAAGTVYMIAFGAIHLLVPKLEKAEIG
jgi:ACS family hexuronate transporter-like MFS transporter